MCIRDSMYVVADVSLDYFKRFPMNLPHLPTSAYSHPDKMCIRDSSYALDCIEAELENIKNKHGKRVAYISTVSYTHLIRLWDIKVVKYNTAYILQLLCPITGYALICRI